MPQVVHLLNLYPAGTKDRPKEFSATEGTEGTEDGGRKTEYR